VSCSARDFHSALRLTFSRHADTERALGATAYMRNQFPFFGIDAPTRRRLIREVQQKLGLPLSVLELADLCWADREREMQYAACDVLSQSKVLRTLTPDDVPRLERLVLQKSWWDTVDVLAPTIIGGLLRPFPELVQWHAQRMIASENIWLQRSAILLQLKYRDATDFDLLAECILLRASSDEFFVRKAAGWALRSYAYVKPDRVRTFVADHRQILSGLTIREALKNVS
jgi:3-methyladenine DNA glycosylase AlkD